MKRLSLLFVFALVTALASAGAAADMASPAAHPVYKADLSGAEIPPVATAATGEAIFQLIPSGAGGAGTGGIEPRGIGPDRSSQETGSTGMGGAGIKEGGIGESGAAGVGSNDTGSYQGIIKGGSETGAGAGGMAAEAMRYELKLDNIKNVTAAHLHMGRKTTAEGPVIAALYLGPKKAGEFNGTLAQGTITAKDLTGPLSGKSINDLVALMNSGDVYVNVHTDQHPAGEIRGVVKPQ